MLPDSNVATKVLVTEAARIAGMRVVENEAATGWPDEMAPEAFIGLAGDFVRLVEPHTEADPAALLANFLIGAGVHFGREAWAVADGRRHYPVEFLMLVGQTGSGRKGTASARVFPVMERVDSDFQRRVLSGLSSGEGLIKAISPKPEELTLPGDVRRHLVFLPEFASLLGVMKREGNTMSAILREAWDCNRLRVLTRKDPLDADNVNLSVVAHITPEELLNSLTATDRANGFGNRFLILLVRRSKYLPEGGNEFNISPIVTRLNDAVQNATGLGAVGRDGSAKALWATEYPRITRSRSGLRGALCGRAEAHILRLSLLYALLDSASSIRREHLVAACAFWDYCERSVDFVFGGISGDFEGDKIIKALGGGVMTITDLHRLFSNNRDTDWILAKMASLERAGKVIQAVKQSGRKGETPGWALRSERSFNAS